MASHLRSISRTGRGFTLVEATIALLVVSVMMVAAMSVAGQSARSRTVQQEQVRGEALARQLLSEIMQMPYQQAGVTTTVLGPETGETRSTYNDVDDFNGWSESPPQYASGTAIPGFTGWKRAAKVEWLSVTGTTSPTVATSATETGLKRITVTVTAPSGKVTTLVGLRSQYSPYEHVPSVKTTYTSYMGVTVQVGSDSTTASSASADLVNQVP
ncbi:MAG TPA: type II secretion system protein [Tepidisphaeraceae bacterium]|jgi:MSHA pilin protein MshD|nr:type II secretion system protein [Tepidisphaeraceae bacterium]